MGQITATRNLVATKVVRHAGQQRLRRYFQPFYPFWGILHPASAMLTFNHAAHETCLA